jgi:hypothetical protein
MERWNSLSQSLTDAVIPTKEQVIKKASKARKLVGEVFEALIVEGHIVGNAIDAAKKNSFKEKTGKSAHNSQQTYYWLKTRGGDFFE